MSTVQIVNGKNSHFDQSLEQKIVKDFRKIFLVWVWSTLFTLPNRVIAPSRKKCWNFKFEYPKRNQNKKNVCTTYHCLSCFICIAICKSFLFWIRHMKQCEQQQEKGALRENTTKEIILCVTAQLWNRKNDINQFKCCTCTHTHNCYNAVCCLFRPRLNRERQWEWKDEGRKRQLQRV